jgi:hypothetical protein
VEGSVIVKASKGMSHQGVKMTIDGAVLTNNSNTGIGIIDALGAGQRSVSILKEDLIISTPGNFPSGVTEIPFQFILAPQGSQPLLESYHGVYVNIVYIVQVVCERGMFSKTLTRDIEFIVEIPLKKPLEAKSGEFEIKPELLENSSNMNISEFPRFRITGRIHRYNCPISLPFTGEVVVDASDVAVRTMELQLVRIETLSLDSVNLREATEVQILQIVDGDVPRNVAIPMYLVFPRLYSCPTIVSSAFNVEFEINLIITFVNGFTVTENFPIKLYREA